MNFFENIESWSKRHFSKKCRVFSASCRLPTKIAGEFRVIECCWGALSETLYGGWDFLEVKNVSYYIFVNFEQRYILSLMNSFSVVISVVCFKEWKGSLIKCRKESIWWGSQFIWKGVPLAGQDYSLFNTYISQILHILTLSILGYIGYHTECWRSSRGRLFSSMCVTLLLFQYFLYGSSICFLICRKQELQRG